MIKRSNDKNCNKESIYTIDYDKIVIFKERIKRFTVTFDFKNNSSYKDKENFYEDDDEKNDRETENTAHLHNSGRLKELLVKGNELFIKKAENKDRKTKWDVVAIKAGEEIILLNSAYHRYIAESILKNEKLSPFGKTLNIKPEAKYDKSRIDFYLETEKDKIYLEIKGCTLIENNIATFPGAPSVRAVKHLNELIKLKKEGLRAAVIILVFRKAESFRPRHETDMEFAEAFYNAKRKGVEIYVMLLSYRNKKIYFEKKLKILKKSF